MIVQRFIWKAKVGCTEKMVELLKAEIAKGTKKWRIYTSDIGQFDLVSGEVEFENLPELEKFWNDWYAQPTTADFLEKWSPLEEHGGGNEVWNLE